MTIIMGIKSLKDHDHSQNTEMTETKSRRRVNEDRAFSHNTVLTARLLGERIRLARQGKQWTEEELAERTRIARATLQKIEKGSLNVAFGLVLEVCMVLDLPLWSENGTILSTHYVPATLKRVRRSKQVEFDDDF